MSSSFSSRYGDPHPSLGDEVPGHVRGTVLATLDRGGLTPLRLGQALLAEEGFASWSDLAAGLADWYGLDESERLRKALRAAAPRVAWSGMSDPRDQAALRVIPTPLFLTAIEVGLRATRRGDLVAEVNELFDKRGVAYTVRHDGTVDWRGDPGTTSLVIHPALEALRDRRLAGARSEFDESLRNVRARTPKDLEHAIGEAAKSVESAMKTLIVEAGAGMPPQHQQTAARLFDALKDHGSVPSYAKGAILAAAQIRNDTAGHGTGQTPRNVSADEAELAVASAAVAIVFLHGRLP